MRPIANRNLDRLGLDVHETSGLETLLLHIIWERGEHATKLLAAFVEELAPFCNGATRFETVVVAAAHGVTFVGFDPAAGLGYLVRALVQGVPVGHAAVEETEVDEVGGVGRERPVEGEVFDLELDVRGNPARGC